MEYRNLGKSGLKISALSLGSWVTFGSQVNTQLAENLMSLAYDNGVNFFDNAEAYAAGESELIMGSVLKKLNWPRDTYCVSSKVFWGGQLPTQRGLSRKHVFDACNAALKRLQVDYVDLFFCHRADIQTPIEETVWIMNDLMRQGKILYWGTSEWTASQIMEAHAIAEKSNLVGPTMEQPEYNMFNREKVERDYRHLYRTYGLGTTIWSPLASGLLTGKYQNGIPKDSRMNLPGYEWLRKMLESKEGEQKINKVKKLSTIANELGISLSKLSLAWCLKNNSVSSVILGASNVKQLEENLDAINQVNRLDDSAMLKIEEILQNKPEAEKDFLS